MKLCCLEKSGISLDYVRKKRNMDGLCEGEKGIWIDCVRKKRIWIDMDRAKVKENS